MNLRFDLSKRVPLTGRDLLGLAATRAAARFIPFGGAGRGPGAGARFTRKFNFLGNSTLETLSRLDLQPKVDVRASERYTYIVSAYFTFKPWSRARAAARTPKRDKSGRGPCGLTKPS